MQFMRALYRAEMHSQAHEKTNNHLKTKNYKIGINLPQKIYEFSKTGMIVTAKNKDTTPCLGPRMLSILSLTCYNRRTKNKIPISHLIDQDEHKFLDELRRHFGMSKKQAEKLIRDVERRS